MTGFFCVFSVISLPALKQLRQAGVPFRENCIHVPDGGLD